MKQKENKLNYENPSVRTVIMERLMTTTFSGQHNPGSNNGVVDGAKGNSFFFDDEEESN
jgi:hypothetical protein